MLNCGTLTFVWAKLLSIIKTKLFDTTSCTWRQWLIPSESSFSVVLNGTQDTPKLYENWPTGAIVKPFKERTWTTSRKIPSKDLGHHTKMTKWRPDHGNNGNANHGRRNHDLKRFIRHTQGPKGHHVGSYGTRAQWWLPPAIIIWWKHTHLLIRIVPPPPLPPPPRIIKHI